MLEKNIKKNKKVLITSLCMPYMSTITKNNIERRIEGHVEKDISKQPLEKKVKRGNISLKGILMMCGHVISISFLYVIVKILSKTVHSNQISFLYRVIIFIMSFILSVKGGLIRNLKTERIELHFLRAFFSIIGSLCMFYALTSLPLTDTTALSKLEHSIMVVLGITVLKEPVTKNKILHAIISLNLFILSIKINKFSSGAFK